LLADCSTFLKLIACFAIVSRSRFGLPCCAGSLSCFVLQLDQIFYSLRQSR
jgi:hypothetical protein